MSTTTSIWHGGTDPDSVPLRMRWRVLSDEVLRDLAERLADGEPYTFLATEYGLHPTIVRQFSAWLLPTKVSVPDDDDDEETTDDTSAIVARRTFLRGMMAGIEDAAEAVVRLRAAIESAMVGLARFRDVASRQRHLAAIDSLTAALPGAERRCAAKEQARDELIATAPEQLRRRYARLMLRIGRCSKTYMECIKRLQGAVSRLDEHHSMQLSQQKHSATRKNANRRIEKFSEQSAVLSGKIESLTLALREFPSLVTRAELVSCTAERARLAKSIKLDRSRVAKLTKQINSDKSEKLTKYHALRRDVEVRQAAADVADNELVRVSKQYHAVFIQLMSNDSDDSEPQSAVARALAHEI